MMLSSIGSVSSVNTLTSTTTGAVSGVGAGNGVASDFSQVLANVATDAIGTMRAGEATAITGIEGKASIQSVVAAVMAAEQTLQAAVSIRDKVVSAYQEISRMAI
jgi:flagellar hook-basal body complex protein FliE